jgi:SAM-dependent methyltransferase
MRLNEDDIVLDLGCGKGTSSVFLAQHYGVRVIAVDLWTDATQLNTTIGQRGLTTEIVPLNVDVRKSFPFADEYFDAIFCMNALPFFGGDVETLNRFATHLKPGGIFCVGGECLSNEFTFEQRAHPPAAYNFMNGIWEGDFLKLHSPPWWESLFHQTDDLDVINCHELEDGRILYEERFISAPPVAYSGFTPQQTRGIDRRIIVYGRSHTPYMTLFLLSTVKQTS